MKNDTKNNTEIEKVASNTTREIKRVMHELKVRMLEVKRIETLTPRMIRVTLTGHDLAGFTSLSPDDHVKAFFPKPGEDIPLVPKFTADGIVMPEGAIPRDYTPRRIDLEKGELDLDFFLHDDTNDAGGPASMWARNAKPGQKLGVAGPRGSFIVPYEFESYVMFADEVGIPSIARRLSEMPRGARVRVFIEVENQDDEIKFSSNADFEVKWLHRKKSEAGTTERLLPAIETCTTIDENTFAWIMTEQTTARILEGKLIERGVPKAYIKATGYWKK